jgi:3-isopropylmalate/(R)-2-methylmalate dehydratase small subunit
MEPISVIEGIAAPLKRSAIDTDQIIPAEFLKRVTKTGFDDALFYRWRQEEDFVLNQPAYQGARIIVAGPDFGTGSSREHAVWALRDFGIQAVISSRFGDIFRGNSGKQGLLTAQLPEADVEKIWSILDANPGISASVDLVARSVSVLDLTVTFEIDDYVRWRLLEGLDDIGLTLRNEDAITAFEARRESWRPRTLPVR